MIEFLLLKTCDESFALFQHSVRPLAKPVHAKNARWISQPLSNVEPVLEIIADVISAERQHRHRIASHLTHSPGSGGGCFRGHGRAQINAVGPIERLINQRHCISTATAENDRANWDASAFLHIKIE